MLFFRLFVLGCAVLLLTSAGLANEPPRADIRDLAELIELVGMGDQARIAADFAQEIIDERVAAGKMDPPEAQLRKRLVQGAYDPQYILEYLAHQPKPLPSLIPCGLSAADFPRSYLLLGQIAGVRPSQLAEIKMKFVKIPAKNRLTALFSASKSPR